MGPPWPIGDATWTAFGGGFLVWGDQTTGLALAEPGSTENSASRDMLPLSGVRRANKSYSACTAACREAAKDHVAAVPRI
jgi:hypothetical protein